MLATVAYLAVISAQLRGSAPGQLLVIDGAPYDQGQLHEKIMASWRGHDFSLFEYPPANREGPAGRSDATRLILDFKNNRPEAVALVTRYAADSLAFSEAQFRDRFGCRYLVAAPRSHAGRPNAPCESLAGELARRHPWLTHLPGALVRLESVPSAHLGQRATQGEHLRTIAYRGPDFTSRLCPICRRLFPNHDERDAHASEAHGRTPYLRGALILIDDVITAGATSRACRERLAGATESLAVIGFFLGRTPDREGYR